MFKTNNQPNLFIFETQILNNEQQGASTSLYLATTEEVDEVSGNYFVNKRPQKSVAFSYDHKTQDKLWQISSELLQQVGQN